MYLYQLTDDDRGVIRGLREDTLGDHLTVVEGLCAEACFSQAAGVDQLEHLETKEEEKQTINGQEGARHLKDRSTADI
jgi:hypothetical protein